MGTGQRDAAELRGHILGVTAWAAGSGSSEKATLGARGQTIIVPAYQYPTLGIWPTLAKIGPSYSPGYVIANIGSGPGTTVDSDYATAIANAKAAGWTIMGYVDTDYANTTVVPVATIEANIDLWYSLYGVIDIFFDRADNTAPNIGYTTNLTNYVHTKHGAGISLFNMGTAPDPGYLSPTVCDGICVFEDLFTTFTGVANYAGYGVNICHIVYGTSAANLVTQLQISADLGANWVYITDEPDDGYYELPSYFGPELALVVPGVDFYGTGTATMTLPATGTARDGGGGRCANVPVPT